MIAIKVSEIERAVLPNNARLVIVAFYIDASDIA
jgi:hypothetical protein